MTTSAHRPVLPDVTLPPAVREALEGCVDVTIPATREELYWLSLGPEHGPKYDVSYEVAGTRVKEVDVVRCTNGITVNFVEDYMRRRDPDCMRIADDLPSDKPRYRDVFGSPFAPVKAETLTWLSEQALIVVPFKAGGLTFGSPSLAIVPANAAFFALALMDLQGWVTFDEIGPYTPRSILYVAPPFRHTHFDGKQVVVHDRSDTLHEVFAYNLYPGPSAKKGVFSVLLDIGEHEGWLTAHASSVRVTTPYENETIIMHEGASGGGKSEMCQDIRREDDGRILLGYNVVSHEPYHITLAQSSRLEPVTDDMTLCHPSVQDGSGKLVVADAEDGWFVRVDNLRSTARTTTSRRCSSTRSSRWCSSTSRAFRTPRPCRGSTPSTRTASRAPTRAWSSHAARSPTWSTSRSRSTCGPSASACRCAPGRSRPTGSWA